jgi:hypothetical protein
MEKQKIALVDLRTIYIRTKRGKEISGAQQYFSAFLPFIEHHLR